MNSYCTVCKEITENYEEKTYWSKTLDLVIVSCEKCNCLKYQYLDKGGEVTYGE